MNSPQADEEEIKRALDILIEPGSPVELRAIHKLRNRIDAGVYDGDHQHELASVAAELNKAGAAVYITMNSIDPQLLSRYHNRLQENAKSTATDANITHRRWLLVDIDPIRPKDTPATDEQFNQAVEKAREIYKHLVNLGWPEPVVAESGNGMHLLYRIDLPNDDKSRDLLKGVLNRLAERFDNKAVTVDRTVFNAGRIMKLYGTVATKGDHTALAPWRLSKILKVPETLSLVSPEQLRAFFPAQPLKESKPKVPGTSFNLDGFLSRLGIPYEVDTHDGRQRYKLQHCPFNPEHGKNDAAIFQGTEGILGFKCQHNSCADKTWKDVRALVDGPEGNRRKAYHPPPVTMNELALGESSRNKSSAPLPLPDELMPVASFDFDLLPESLRAWAEDISDRLQCPPDFVAVGIMTTLAAVIGRKVGIRPQEHTSWTVIVNLWALIIGRPGVLKSPALEEVLAPLKRLIAIAIEEYQQILDQYKVGLAVAKLRAEANEKAARKDIANKSDEELLAVLAVTEPRAPILRRYMTNDTSPASLGEVIRLNQNGLLIYRDELVSLLKGLDREDQAEGRGFYLTGWNGDSSYTIDRIGRGLNLYIEAVCLSLLGGTQPGRVSEYISQAIKGGTADDGLIQRFGLMVWPDIGGVWKNVDRTPDSKAKNQAFKVYEYLDKLDPVAIGAHQDTDIDGNPEGIPYLRFDAEALALFLEWRTDLEGRLREGDLHPALESHFAKYRKLIPSLALIIHMADRNCGQVGKQATLQALAWGEYLETHALRAYAAGLQPDVATAKAILKRIKKGDLAKSFSTREVSRPKWSMLTDIDRVKNALRLLVDYNHLHEERVETGGRPTTIFHFNEGEPR